jgi:Holliday junction DNA helicase RuvA
MPRFALMVQQEIAADTNDASSEVVKETFDALVTLGHSESDARKLIDDAIATGKKFKDIESLLTAIYQRTG